LIQFRGALKQFSIGFQDILYVFISRHVILVFLKPNSF